MDFNPYFFCKPVSYTEVTRMSLFWLACILRVLAALTPYLWNNSFLYFHIWVFGRKKQTLKFTAYLWVYKHCISLSKYRQKEREDTGEGGKWGQSCMRIIN